MYILRKRSIYTGVFLMSLEFTPIRIYPAYSTKKIREEFLLIKSITEKDFIKCLRLESIYSNVEG